MRAMSGEDDVLSNLPRTRPQRRSAKRDAPARTAKGTAPAPKAKAAAKPRAAAAAKPKPKPKPVAHDLPPSGFQQPRENAERPAPSGAELVGTAIQAAGELAQIGAAVGRQALRSALGRLGRG